MRNQYLIALCLLFHAQPAHADFIEYHTSNIQLLKGWDYKVGDEGRTLATLEHCNKWAYGDFFMFVDMTRFDEGGSNIYGEFSPRISFSKASGQNVSIGPIKDFYLSGMLEKGKNSVRTYLYGSGVDMDVPSFKIFRVDAYIRDKPDIYGKTWQLTWAWKYPFQAGGLKFMCEGLTDFAGDEGARYHPNQFIVPRLLLDIGNAAGRKEGELFAGIEYQYWHNKFGIRGTTESVPQLQVKWIFD